MCYAIATNASKDWSNARDLYRSPIHIAVLTVSKPNYLHIYTFHTHESIVSRLKYHFNDAFYQLIKPSSYSHYLFEFTVAIKL